MTHWLHQSYLGDSDLLTPTVSSEVETAPQQEMIMLPGGVIIPKKTLLLILAAVVAAYLYWKHKKDV